MKATWQTPKQWSRTLVSVVSIRRYRSRTQLRGACGLSSRRMTGAVISRATARPPNSIDEKREGGLVSPSLRGRSSSRKQRITIVSNNGAPFRAVVRQTICELMGRPDVRAHEYLPLFSSAGRRPSGVMSSTALGKSRLRRLRISSRDNPVFSASSSRTSGPRTSES